MSPRPRGPGLAAAPAARPPQMVAIRSPPARGSFRKWRMGAGGCLSSSFCFLSGHLALLIVISLGLFLRRLFPVCTCICTCPCAFAHVCVHTRTLWPSFPADPGHFLAGRLSVCCPACLTQVEAVESAAAEDLAGGRGGGFYFPSGSSLPTCQLWSCGFIQRPEVQFPWLHPSTLPRSLPSHRGHSARALCAVSPASCCLF